MLELLPESCDVLCTHPMFGPESGKDGWQELPFVFERTRVAPAGQDRAEHFLSIFERRGCRMVELSCRDHDECVRRRFCRRPAAASLPAPPLSP